MGGGGKLNFMWNKNLTGQNLGGSYIFILLYSLIEEGMSGNKL